MKYSIARSALLILLCMMTPVMAQYAPPAWIPDAHATGIEDDRSIEVGLAIDVSGGSPYRAAFLGEYVSDGTPAGTRLIDNGLSVNDVAAIPNGVGAYLVARGAENPTNDQLYYTDGTSAGTHILAELIPAFPDGVRKIHGFVQGALVVQTEGARLVVTNGTLAGTFEVRPDIFGLTSIERVSIGATQGFAQIGESQGNHIIRFGPTPGESREITPASSTLFHADELTAFGDHACFVAGQSEVGTSTYGALYCTDGTVAGTSAITSGDSGSPFGIYQGDGGGLQRFGSMLYFVPVWKPDQNSTEIHQSPWSTDGTQTGTHSLTIASTMPWNRIGTADGRVFFSDYFQGTGLPFSSSDGSAAHTQEILRGSWEVNGLSRGDRENPTFGSAVFFTSWEYGTPDSYPQLRRTDGSSSGTFPMPEPDSIPAGEWSPATALKPAVLGHHLLVENAGAAGGIWSYDLDGIFAGKFD